SPDAGSRFRLFFSRGLVRLSSALHDPFFLGGSAMRGLYYTIGLLTILGMMLPAFAADEKKDTEKKPPVTTAPKDNKMVTVGQIEGKLTKVELEGKIVVIEVKIPYLQGRNVSHQTKTHELSMAEDIQVFWKQLPVEYDDKGKPKKPNPKEVKKPVKGPGGIMGYPADTDTLRKDQVVLAVLRQKKDAPKPMPKKDKDLVVDENRPVISAIYILFEPRK